MSFGSEFTAFNARQTEVASKGQFFEKKKTTGTEKIYQLK